MKFRLKESVGYTYAPNDPELYGYDLELDPYELYDKLLENFDIQEVADILIENGFCNEETQEEMKDADEDYLAEIVMDTITSTMNIYDLLGINEFRNIIQDQIEDEEAQLLLDVQDSAAFASSHGPEI